MIRPFKCANAWGLEIPRGELPPRTIFAVHPRIRARRFIWEWYNHEGVTWLNFGIARPRHHAKWAFSAWLYLRG